MRKRLVQRLFSAALESGRNRVGAVEDAATFDCQGGQLRVGALLAESEFERDRLIGHFGPDPSALSTMKAHEAIVLHRLQRPG